MSEFLTKNKDANKPKDIFSNMKSYSISELMKIAPDIMHNPSSTWKLKREINQYDQAEDRILMIENTPTNKNEIIFARFLVSVARKNKIHVTFLANDAWGLFPGFGPNPDNM